MDTTLVRLLEDISRLINLLLDQEADEECKYQIVLAYKVLARNKTSVAEEARLSPGFCISREIGSIIKKLDTPGTVLCWGMHKGSAIEAATRIFKAGGRVYIERTKSEKD